MSTTDLPTPASCRWRGTSEPTWNDIPMMIAANQKKHISPKLNSLLKAKHTFFAPGTYAVDVRRDGNYLFTYEVRVRKQGYYGVVVLRSGVISVLICTG
ncbi:MAG: hypothetical protein RIB71_04540 [Imperialibacter sp.]|uniref:hypothetical protein n=1 Tax=Imperialibacter sp. TaxID=2038411 RepID=UPI0032EAB1F4